MSTRRTSAPYSGSSGRGEPLRRNQQAAFLGAVAGILLAISGYTGANSVERLFRILVEFFGVNPLFRGVAFVVLVIANLGGLSVLFGAFLIWTDRVRTGRVFILVGSGAGFLTLFLFLMANLRREEFSFLWSVLPAILGVAIGVVARFRAVPRPILEAFRGP